MAAPPNDGSATNVLVAPGAPLAPTYTQPTYPSTNYVQGYYDMPEKPYETSYTQSQQTQAEPTYTQPYGTQSQYTQPPATISSITPQAPGSSYQSNVNEPAYFEEAQGSDTHQVQRQRAQPAQQSQPSGIQQGQAAQTQAAPETIPTPVRQPPPSTSSE